MEWSVHRLLLKRILYFCLWVSCFVLLTYYLRNLRAGFQFPSVIKTKEMNTREDFHREWLSQHRPRVERQAIIKPCNNNMAWGQVKNGWKKPNKRNLRTAWSLPSFLKMKEKKRIEDFRRDWLRQRRARVDWQAIIKPCYDNMAWGQVKHGWEKSNRSNASTSDVIFLDIRPAGEFSKIFIQSKTSDNRTKMIGGDTWRIHVRGPSSVAVTVFDHNNGTYEALFLITEPGVYQLMIYLDYSLCDGFRDPPRDWFIKGNAQGKFQKEGLLGTLDDYLIQPLKNGSHLEINVTQAEMDVSLTGRLENHAIRNHNCPSI